MANELNLNRRQPHRALVVSRSLAGHRQIYLHVFAQYLLERGFDIVVAVEDGQHSPLLNLLRLNPRIRTIPIQYGASSTKLIPFVFLKQVQVNNGIGLSVFVDGDDLRRSMIAARTAARSLGPSIGIFLQLTRFAPIPKTAPNIQAVLAIARYLRYRLADEMFFGHSLRVCNNSFQAFVLDPRLPDVLIRPNLHWLPDIYAPFDDEANIEQGGLYDDLQMFLAGSAAQERILYYGTNQMRRGYEWLLRLVCERSNTVLLHCGRLNEHQDMSETTRQQRLQLVGEGRLFETQCFVTDRRITDSVYAACKYVLLPYQNHYGSSGVMLQAANYGKPVLVPRGGLMAYWVDQHGIGRTFIENSYESFLQEWSVLKRNYEDYEEPAKRFAKKFAREQVYETLDRGLAQVEK